MGLPFSAANDELPYHTHCLLLDAKQCWSTGKVSELAARRLGTPCEFVLADWLLRHFSGDVWHRWDKLCRPYLETGVGFPAPRLPRQSPNTRPWGFLWHDSV